MVTILERKNDVTKNALAEMYGFIPENRTSQRNQNPYFGKSKVLLRRNAHFQNLS